MSRFNRLVPVRFCPLLAVLVLGCGEDSPVDVAENSGTSGNETASADGDATAGAWEMTGNAASEADAGQTGARDPTGNPGAGGDGGGVAIADDAAASAFVDSGAGSGGTGLDASELPPFSFFVTSMAAILELADDPQGFGGDLRYGETGDGAGLRGADKICAEIAEGSMPGAAAKQWRAFLSASSGGADGGPVHARDRIGEGPWYDRLGRLVGNGLDDLIGGDRPTAANPAIRNDLPNEHGVANHAPDGQRVDNHDTLTGSDEEGRYVDGSNTCDDWTSTATAGAAAGVGFGGRSGGGGGGGPAIGHSWPRSATSGRHWISDHRAGGCAKGINISSGAGNE